MNTEEYKMLRDEIADLRRQVSNLRFILILIGGILGCLMFPFEVLRYIIGAFLFLWVAGFIVSRFTTPAPDSEGTQ